MTTYSKALCRRSDHGRRIPGRGLRPAAARARRPGGRVLRGGGRARLGIVRALEPTRVIEEACMTENGKPILQRTFTGRVRDARRAESWRAAWSPTGRRPKVRRARTGPALLRGLRAGRVPQAVAGRPTRSSSATSIATGLTSSIGIGRELHEQAHGLFGVFHVHPGAFGDQALELVRAGVLPGFSIDFETGSRTGSARARARSSGRTAGSSMSR